MSASSRGIVAYTLLVAVSVVAGSSCGNPPPTCAATETPYTICSDNQVWECQRGTQAQIDAKKAIDTACGKQTDPIKCILDAKYEQTAMKMVADCKAGGQMCVVAGMPLPDGGTSPTAKTASCKAP